LPFLLDSMSLTMKSKLSLVQVYSIPSLNGDYIQQTVTIDNEKKVAIIHIHEGACSSETIFDYKHGYIAMQIFSRFACFVMKMEKHYFLEIEEIGRLAYELQMMRRMLSGRNLWVKYEPANYFLGEIKEWLIFGKPIEQLCRHIPVYKVERLESEYPRRNSCVKTGILHIFNISICEKINIL
uniref:Gastrokine-2 n=1 Tax=Laticauda laticaudata TaxID=8630 RepID=A0A8C5SS03_LATLA